MAVQTNAISRLPIDESVIFTNHKDVHSKRIERRQAKLLKKVGFIGPFLEEGEKILQVTTGCSPASLIEQVLTGWIVFILKRSLLIFTDRRVFHVPTKSDFSYRSSIAQICYADCKSLAIKGRTLIAQYRDGSKESFFYLARREAKRMKALLPGVAKDGLQSKAGRRVHLCPRCAKELTPGVFTCTNCQLEFKSGAEGRKLSLLWPGGGYFYARHPFLGLGDAIAESGLILFLIVSVMDAMSGEPESEQAWILVLFLALALVYEKLLTVYHTDHFLKEYLPKDTDIEPGSAPEFDRPVPIG
jgi:hypothetical protein